jgi:CDP-diglyceride synthetase
MSPQSRRMAGILLVLMPAVVYGGTAILSMLVGDPAYTHNHLRQDLWRAGHAHAGVLLVLSLVTLRYVDEAKLSENMKLLVRHSIPAAAILLPAAFFLSVLSPSATKPNAMIYLAYVGAVLLAVGLLVLGIGLIRASRMSHEA